MPCQINNTSNFDISEIEELIQDLFSFSQNRFGYKESPCLNLVSDEKNTSPLGSTAHYDPNSMEITIYVDGRHPKDIMRSFSHELIHHNQNENGMFDQTNNTGDGYAQSNPHLRKMEKEAYLKGNMCFRDWEDGYKTSNPNILNERRIYKMSTKKWKNKELNGLLNEKWGFSMNLGRLNEGCADVKKEEVYEEGEEIEEMQIRSSLGGASEIGPEVEDDKKEEFEKTIHSSEAPPNVDQAEIERILGALTINQLLQALKSKQEDLQEQIVQEAEEATIGKRFQQMSSIRNALIQGIKEETGLMIPANKISALVDMVIELAVTDTISRSLGYKRFSKAPSQDNAQGSEESSDPSVQIKEEKLRETIRKIIKSKFNKKKK